MFCCRWIYFLSVFGQTIAIGPIGVDRTNATDSHDLHATILHLLGFDPEQLTSHYSGRDFRLTDIAGKVAKAIIAWRDPVSNITLSGSIPLEPTTMGKQFLYTSTRSILMGWEKLIVWLSFLRNAIEDGCFADVGSTRTRAIKVKGKRNEPSCWPW